MLITINWHPTLHYIRIPHICDVPYHAIQTLWLTIYGSFMVIEYIPKSQIKLSFTASTIWSLMYEIVWLISPKGKNYTRNHIRSLDGRMVVGWFYVFCCWRDWLVTVRFLSTLFFFCGKGSMKTKQGEKSYRRRVTSELWITLLESCFPETWGCSGWRWDLYSIMHQVRVRIKLMSGVLRIVGMTG